MEISNSHMPYKMITDTVVPIHVIKVYRGSGGAAPLILNYCTK